MPEIIAPPWLAGARADLGKREQPENRGPYIRALIEQAHCGTEGDPWCAIFVNAKLEAVGIKGTRSALAQSFAHSSLFYRLGHPLHGCIVVFWRGSRGSGLGHVGFAVAVSSERVGTLGGNEHDQVAVEWYPKNGARFGLLGYYWPHGVPETQRVLGASDPGSVADGGSAPKVT